ncbi:MAG: two-component regulator propeller domain-containing protein, partial [Bacteroidales bacterium]
GLSDNSVTSIVKDGEDFMWIATRNGLNRYDGYEFKKYYADESKTSLPENSIVKLHLSQDKTLWIATENSGICYYNPLTESFNRISFVNENKSLAADIIKGITEDTDSVLYVASSEGLFYKEPGAENFQEIEYVNHSSEPADPRKLLNPLLATITPDEEEGIWIAYESWQISYYNHRNHTFTHYSLEEFKDKNQQSLISALLHKNNKLWIGTVGSDFIVYDPRSGTTEVLFENEGLNSVREIRYNTDEILWIASGSGLINYDLTTGKYHRFTNITEDSRSLSTTPVNCSYQDETGILWVGLYNAGINYSFLNKPFSHFMVGLDEYFNLRWKDISSILHDREGNLWIGYMGGIVELHDYERQEKFNIPINSLSGNTGPGSIFKIFQDSEGDIYCGSWTGGLQIFNKRSRSFIPVTGSKSRYLRLFKAIDIRDIEEDNEGRLWLAVHGKGVYVFDKKSYNIQKYISVEADTTTLSNEWVYDICIDKNNSVWVGSGWGLSRISPEENKVKRYHSSEAPPSLSHNSTLIVTTDRSGRLWVGTNNGLNYYDRENDVFYPFLLNNQTADNQIKSIEQDLSGYYWVSTTNGISRFILDHDSTGVPYLSDIHSFDIYDGLQSEYYNLNCSSIDSEGKLYFGGDNGIDYFNPSKIKPGEVEPRLKVLKIEVNGMPLFSDEKDMPKINREGDYVLHHKENLVAFEYAALNYFSNERNRYSYKLSPLHTNWVSAENKRYIMFSNLDPGRYSLSLRVKPGQGEAREANDLVSFYIKPPFWKTTIFRILFFLLIIALVFGSVSLYTTSLRQNQNILEKTVNERTRELRIKNRELEEQSMELNQTNILLKERQKQIEDQAKELKKQSDELKKTNSELSLLNSMKDKFFSIIAHDLKNPFNTILGFTELLRDGYENYDDDKRKEMIEYIYHSVHNAQSLLENLLHWSRSQTNQLHARPQKLVLIDLVERNFALISPMLDKKSLNFSLGINKDITVKADTELLNTILRNLLSNAIKFTQENGQILITASPNNKNFIKIEVRDNGIGIEPSELDSIFRIDTKVTRYGTAGEAGTGLGMILCKEFVEKMGGEIWIESKKGQGTSVFFTLPEYKN